MEKQNVTTSNGGDAVVRERGGENWREGEMRMESCEGGEKLERMKG